MIEGVVVKNLRVIPDERGRLMEILRSDDPMFKAFGQVYMTTAYPGVVKGWHYHKKQEDNMAVLRGMMKIVLYDARSGSSTFGQVDEIIDYIWFKGFSSCTEYQTITKPYMERTFVSDHYPIKATLIF